MIDKYLMLLIYKALLQVNKKNANITIDKKTNEMNRPFVQPCIHTKIEKILTPEQIEQMSAEEINKVLKEKLYYNEYEYQLNNNTMYKHLQHMLMIKGA